MSGMNGKRVVLGGLAAGLVINVVEFGVEPLLGATFEQWLRSLGLQPPAESAMLGLAVLGFLVGIVTVWLYAAIRPRFGPGPRTAVMAGVVTWGLECLIPNVAMAMFGVLTGQLLWLATIIPLVELTLAALCGAWLYREEPAVAPRVHATA